MHVIWKRPDGFHGADPSDYTVVTLGDGAKLWLHRKDHSWYPFRIAGGWQESEATQKLNNLVNLLSEPSDVWVRTLVKIFNDTMGDDPGKFVDETTRWVADLRDHLKGDTWEIEIMMHALTDVEKHLTTGRAEFLKAAR